MLTCLYWTSFFKTWLRTCAISAYVTGPGQRADRRRAMGSRVFQNPHDHTGLVLRRNRSVLTGAEWDVQHSAANHRCKNEQPFGKVRWAKMGRGNSRPSKTCSESQ